MKSIHLDRTGVRLAGLISILICIAGPARADDSHLLRPADTSSPRATLQGFIETTDDVFRRLAAVLKSVRQLRQAVSQSRGTSRA